MPLGGPWNPGEPFSGPGRSQRTVGPRKRLEKASGADTGETGGTGSGPDRRSGRRPGARRPRKSQGGGRRGKYIRRCPETGRTGPGRGKEPRKSEAKRLNDMKTAVTLLVTSTALFRIRAPGSRPWQFSLIPGPALGLPGTAGVPAGHAGKAADRRTAHPLCQDLQHRPPPAPGSPEGQPGTSQPGQTEGPQRGGRDHPPGAHAESRARPNPREQDLPYNERKQDRTLPQKTRAPRKGAANNPRWRSRY